MPNYTGGQHIERCELPRCGRAVVRGLGINPKTNRKYLTYEKYCKVHKQ